MVYATVYVLGWRQADMYIPIHIMYYVHSDCVREVVVQSGS